MSAGFVTCQCTDQQLALMFDLMDAGRGQVEASLIAYGQIPPGEPVWETYVAAVPEATTLTKAWCRVTVRGLFTQLRARLGMPEVDAGARP